MSGIVIEKEGELDSQIQQLDKGIKTAFTQIYDEFEDHLHAINENTSEVQENYTYLCEMDNKIAKLNERIDEIHHMLAKLTGKKEIGRASCRERV